jgi:hypothetical protein
LALISSDTSGPFLVDSETEQKKRREEKKKKKEEKKDSENEEDDEKSPLQGDKARRCANTAAST